MDFNYMGEVKKSPRGIAGVVYLIWFLSFVIILSEFFSLIGVNNHFLFIFIGGFSSISIVFTVIFLFLPGVIGLHLLSLILAGVYFFAARGVLLRNNKWRIVLMIISGFVFLGAIFNLFRFGYLLENVSVFSGYSAIFGFVISGYLFIYLGFAKSSKNWFIRKE